MFSRIKAVAVAAVTAVTPVAAQAQENYLGQIIVGGWTFCPRNTVPADGQLLAIAQYTALFSLYGTTYGGDGRQTFMLPDLRGRIPMHTGHGPGLSPRAQGIPGGTESVKLSVNQMPAHSHGAVTDVYGTSDTASQSSPGGNLPATLFGSSAYAPAPQPANLTQMNPSMAATAVESAGGGANVPIMNPFNVIRYCVVTAGIYPPRN